LARGEPCHAEKQSALSCLGYWNELPGAGLSGACTSAAQELKPFGCAAPEIGGKLIMSDQRNPCAAIREVWEKQGKRLWDDRTHGQGLCLLIVDMLASISDKQRSLGRSFEFWRDQNKIRGRFIGDGAGAGFVVAKLNCDGIPTLEIRTAEIVKRHKVAPRPF
jgi:hypothetical protein